MQQRSESGGAAPAAARECEVCGASGLIPVLDLGMHPLCDDLVEVGSARVCAECPISILHCAECNTSFQEHNVVRTELFPADYHYRSRFTNDVLQGMKELVDSIEQRTGPLTGKLALDVGCNDGSLLDFLAERGARTVGIEPTGAAKDAMGRGHVIFNAYFDVASAKEIVAAHGKPSIITFTNVFAHIEDLGGLLDALRVLCSDDTVICIENHYLGAVLDRYQFDTFYHEHPRTYSLRSLHKVAERLGLNLFHFEFPARYGGNIRVMLGKREISEDTQRRMKEVYAKEASFPGRLKEFPAAIDAWVRHTRARLDELIARHGKLHAKAFPGRAAILVKLLCLDESDIAAVAEKPGSLKIGHYLPGTRIPIISDDELFELEPQPPVIVNLAWHIAAEIEQYLRARGFRGEIVNILTPATFPR